MCLAHLHNEGVEFVEYFRAFLEVRFEERFYLVVRRALRKYAMAFHKSASVGVHDKCWPAKGIEQNRIGCFGTYAGYGKKFVSETGGWYALGILKAVLEAATEPAGEALQAPGLLVVVAGRSDGARETVAPYAPYRCRSEETAFFHVINSFLNVFPVGVLRKDRPHADLEGGLRRPPVLRAEGVKKNLVHSFDTAHNAELYQK